eukprot:10584249-Heterocapsa_arctica.AAC.1
MTTADKAAALTKEKVAATTVMVLVADPAADRLWLLAALAARKAAEKAAEMFAEQTAADEAAELAWTMATELRFDATLLLSFDTAVA